MTEVAGRLQLTHPAVVQSLDDMAGMGLVRRSKDPRDGRPTVLSLSAKGRRMMVPLHEAWEHIGRVQERVFEEAGGDVLGMLDRVTAALDEKSLSDRVIERAARSKRARTASRRRTPTGT